jgi:hypothetical protein
MAMITSMAMRSIARISMRASMWGSIRRVLGPLTLRGRALRRRVSAPRISDPPDFDSSAVEPPGVEDPGWAAALRVTGRVGAWALPLGAAGQVVAVLWGWPSPGLGTNRPGTWLVLAVGSLAFGLLGVVSLAALLMPTPSRRLAASATSAVVLGAMLLAPILGVLGLARPAVSNAAKSLGDSAPHCTRK